MKRAMRLEPYYPEWVASVAAYGHLALGEYEQANAIYAAHFASKKDNSHTRFFALCGLAAIAVFQGDVKGGQKHITKLLQLKPNSNIKHLHSRIWYGKDKTFTARYLDAVRQAGLPENPPGMKPKKPSIFFFKQKTAYDV